MRPTNDSNSTIYAKILDELPHELRFEPVQLEAGVRRRSEAEIQYSLIPVSAALRISATSIFAIKARCGSRNAGLRYRWRDYRHLSDLEEAKRHSVFLIRSRQIENREAQWRVYVERVAPSRACASTAVAMNFAIFCWTASARRGKLVTRLYEIERSQSIWILLDSGRLMRTRVAGLSKLDYAVNAALTLAQVALYSGDRVGLVAYGRAIRNASQQPAVVRTSCRSWASWRW